MNKSKQSQGRAANHDVFEKVVLDLIVNTAPHPVEIEANNDTVLPLMLTKVCKLMRHGVSFKSTYLSQHSGLGGRLQEQNRDIINCCADKDYAARDTLIAGFRTVNDTASRDYLVRRSRTVTERLILHTTPRNSITRKKQTRMYG